MAPAWVTWCVENVGMVAIPCGLLTLILSFFAKRDARGREHFMAAGFGVQVPIALTLCFPAAFNDADLLAKLSIHAVLFGGLGLLVFSFMSLKDHFG